MRCEVGRLSRLYCVTVETTNPQPKIRRRWVLLLVLGGLIITALAFGGDLIPGISYEDWAVWQSIFTNFGVGIVSAAVLLMFEPKFRKVVTDTVTNATAGVTEELRGAVQADLEERLAPLTERIDSLYEARLANQDAAIDDLAKDFTYNRVKEAFQETSDVNALFTNALVVQAEDEPGKLHIRLQWRAPYLSGMYFDRDVVHTEEDHDLYLAAIPENPQRTAEVVWEPQEDFTAVAGKLADELRRNRGRGLGEKIFWEPILMRFEKGIKTAVSASNKTLGALPLEGPLVEIAGTDSAPWFLTSDGIYHPAQDWYLPRRSIGTNTGRSHNVRPGKVVEKPDWADPNEWSYIITSARDHYTSW